MSERIYVLESIVTGQGGSNSTDLRDVLERYVPGYLVCEQEIAKPETRRRLHGEFFGYVINDGVIMSSPEDVEPASEVF